MMKKLLALRWVLGTVLALAVGLSAVPVIMASSGNATITVYARGGALGQRVTVQWGDPLGGWHQVDGWTGTLDNFTPQGVPFKSWTVGSANYGQGPFRWVIYNPDGVTIWAIGPAFTLPTIDGTNYGQPLDQQVTTATAPVVPVTAPGSPAAPAPTAPLLLAHTFTYGFGCSGACGDSKITALIGGLPSSIWITVQWQDGVGVWRTVDGWQGTASSVDNNGVLFQQWDVGPELFGRGPFRWVLYSFQGGSIVGISPNFNMPATSHLNLFMSMAPYTQP
jgi:hypothetical protein